MITPLNLEQAKAFVREAATIRNDQSFDELRSFPLQYATCIDGRGYQKSLEGGNDILEKVGYAYPGAGMGVLATTYAVLHELGDDEEIIHHIIDAVVKACGDKVSFHSDDHAMHPGEHHDNESFWKGCGFLKMCFESSETTEKNPAGLTIGDIHQAQHIIERHHKNVCILSGNHEERAIFVVLPSIHEASFMSIWRQAVVPEIASTPCQAFVVNQGVGMIALQAYLEKLLQIMHESNISINQQTLHDLFVEKMTMQTNQIVERLAPHLPIYGVRLDIANMPEIIVLKEAIL